MGPSQLSPHKKTAIDKLALAIFTRFSPQDPATRRYSCPQCNANIKDFDTRCNACGTGFPACTFSGRPIIDSGEAARCKACKRSFIKSEARQKRNCALCHQALMSRES